MTIRMLAVVLGFGATLSAGTVMAQPSAAPRTVAKLTSIVGGVLVSQADAMAAATGEQRLAPSTRVITTAGGSATVVYDKGCAVRAANARRRRSRRWARRLISPCSAERQ